MWHRINTLFSCIKARPMITVGPWISTRLPRSSELMICRSRRSSNSFRCLHRTAANREMIVDSRASTIESQSKLRGCMDREVYSGCQGHHERERGRESFAIVMQDTTHIAENEGMPLTNSERVAIATGL